jgi:hypothetical protein
MDSPVAPDTAASAPPSPDARAPKRLIARLIGVLIAPRATYRDVAERPRSLGVLLAVMAVLVGTSTAVLSTEVGKQALLDQQVRTLESFGRQVTEAQYRRFERMGPQVALINAGGQIAGVPLAVALVAGVMFGITKAVLGGGASYAQVFAIVAHSFVIQAVRAIVSAPLEYLEGTLASPTSVATLLPFLAEGSFDSRLLGSVDLFILWWLISVAIGVAELSRRRAAPIAAGLLVAYATIALVVAAIGAAVAGA